MEPLRANPSDGPTKRCSCETLVPELLKVELSNVPSTYVPTLACESCIVNGLGSWYRGIYNAWLNTFLQKRKMTPAPTRMSHCADRFALTQVLLQPRQQSITCRLRFWPRLLAKTCLRRDVD